MPGYGVSFRSGTERVFQIPTDCNLSDALAGLQAAGFDPDVIHAMASSSALAKSRGTAPAATAPEQLTKAEVTQLTALAVDDLLSGRGETQAVRLARHALRYETSGKCTPVEATDDSEHPDDGEQGTPTDLAGQPAFLTGMFRHGGAVLPVMKRPRTDGWAQGDDTNSTGE